MSRRPYRDCMRGWWVVVVVILLAGCSGLAADGTPTAEPTATGTPAPTESPTTKTITSGPLSPTQTTIPDWDGDGLNNNQERKISSDPNASDTDGDGLTDREEVPLESDPTNVDTDGDGLEDGREVELGTSPTVEDSDFDRLNDGREVEIGSDPTTMDSDGDGIDDGREVEVGLSPVSENADGDELSDAEELSREDRDPTVDDQIFDSDGDGLNDTREKRLGLDPSNNDTDGDWLSDGAEVSEGFDPKNPDMDDDGIPDGWEYRNRIRGKNFTLPDADPHHKDLYLTINERSKSISNESLRETTELLEKMPVENPDGEGGVKMHWRRVDSRVSPGPVESVVVANGLPSDCGHAAGCYIGASNGGVFLARPTPAVLIHELIHSFPSCDSYAADHVEPGYYMSENVTDGDRKYHPKTKSKLKEYGLAFDAFVYDRLNSPAIPDPDSNDLGLDVCTE